MVFTQARFSGCFAMGLHRVVLLLHSKHFTVSNQLVAIQFHRRLPSQKIQQDGNPLTLRHYSGYNGLKAMKNTVCNFNGIARIEILGKCFYLLNAHCGSQFGNRHLRDGRPAGAKMNHVSNSTNGLHQAQLGDQVEMCE